MNNLSTNDAFYRIWHYVAKFEESLETKFLNAEIQSDFGKFAVHVTEISHLAALKLFTIETPGQKYAAEYEMQGIEIKLLLKDTI